jgi:phosphoglucosamine mutase
MFGRDGMRAIAVTELTCELALQIGRAAAVVLAAHNSEKTRILVGMDTRSSSDSIAAALCSGICSAGADAELVGEVPTPALAWLVREQGANGGIMVTASHINAEFSGIKLFSASGHRLSDDREEEIERLILDNPGEIIPIPRRNYGRLTFSGNALEKYIAHIKETASADLSGLKVAIDCANGCASATAKDIFSSLGAEVVLIGNVPDGSNINKDCGSTHIDSLMRTVKENECSCGIAFDGAAERCLAVDENGSLVDGDVIIAVCAKDMKERGILRNDSMIFTQANNLGLLQFARTSGIGTSASSPGERSMIRRMLECGYSLGGDPAGHILFPDEAPSADGQLTGIRLLDVLARSGKKMSELSAVIEKCPQVMLNVPIDKRFREVWKNDRAVTGIIDEFEEILGEEGRVVVREVGAEPVIRIMIEGRDFTTINTMALQIADTIKERLTLHQPH